MKANIKWSCTPNETVLCQRTQQQEWKNFYSLKQVQTVKKPRFYPLLFQLSVKTIMVINPVCTCQDTCWGGWLFKDSKTSFFFGGGGVPSEWFYLRVFCFGLLGITLFLVSFRLLDISFWSMLQCMQIEWQGVCVLHDFELLRCCILSNFELCFNV